MSEVSNKTVKGLALVWFTLWMGVIAPGHTRGVVRLPGMDGTDSAAAACCCDSAGTCDAADTPGTASDTDDDTPADPAKCCAVCYFNATLNTPPPVTLYTPYLGQLDELTYLSRAAQTPHARRSPDVNRGRPPPGVSPTPIS